MSQLGAEEGPEPVDSLAFDTPNEMRHETPERKGASELTHR